MVRHAPRPETLQALVVFRYTRIMTLTFAYGSNMSMVLMRARCPGAEPLGVAVLEGWRFRVNGDGYATVVPRAGARVHGVLWRLETGDVAALNIYEGIDVGLYRRQRLPVTIGGRRRTALVYVARNAASGRPRPGYLPVVIAAACAAGLPVAYVDALRRWAPSRWTGAPTTEPGALA